MNERMATQLRVIRAVVTVLGEADISAWLFGGWGLDARIGRITREHGDVEFWVERADAGRSKDVLVEAGATALATQPPEESACSWPLILGPQPARSDNATVITVATPGAAGEAWTAEARG